MKPIVGNNDTNNTKNRILYPSGGPIVEGE